MNFLKKIKALFSKDVEEVKEIEQELSPTIGHECYWCEEDILMDQKKKSFNKRKFHIKCYRQMIKSAKKEIGA